MIGYTSSCLPFLKIRLLPRITEHRVVHVISVWTTYLLAAAAASGIFLIAGWRSKQARSRGSRGAPSDPLWSETELDLSVSHSQTDIAAAIRMALKRLAPLMAGKSVQAEIAAPSGLMVRMRGAAVVDLLEEILAASVHSAPASRLLVTASRHGDRVYISMTDDMPGADLAVRMGSVRSLMERVALRGSALDVDVRPREGTTLTLRLAAVLENEWALPAPAKGAPPPLIPSLS